ncbi:hypothetical protein SAMN05444487_11439 [Marininema mesophilum]|uniref:KinB signaling pathway activation protein n=1 Tax=Marininema mesophilum TaxID=1048340 RepID=A0A1H3AUP9_9BACL|nr:CBO0543 family protein [Marininema mesophilum]SDX32569.1 hypothetical protein SAMN05444487_11439 [Marininema mesophilum]
MVFTSWLIVWWIIGLLYIDWKRWRIGYTTALAGSLGSFILDAAFVSGGFWSYSDDFYKGLWPNILLNISIYPVGAWIFVQRLPKTAGKWVRWVLVGTVALLAVEFNLRSLGHMSYHHGWNIGWSALANVVLLTLLSIHFIKVEEGAITSNS